MSAWHSWSLLDPERNRKLGPIPAQFVTPGRVRRSLSKDPSSETQMKKLFGSMGMFLGSTAGWYATDKLGFMTAFFVSTIAGGVGLYYGVKLANQWIG